MEGILDTLEIYERGLSDPTCLTSDERFLYLLIEVETYSMMEGWDGFFRSSVTMPYYAELKSGLQMINAESSLAVLTAYEVEVTRLGFTVTDDGINDMLASDVFAGIGVPHNYSDDWFASSEEMWEKVRSYFR
jgi:hypothetical protein